MSKGTMWKYIFIALGLFILFSVIGHGCWFADRAMTVVKNEVDPVVLQQKYEWFKDHLAGMDATRNNISVLESRIQDLENDYAGIARNEWPRSDRQQLAQWRQEVAGVKGKYNTMAGRYNAQMAKWNWRFTNVGGLPEGETKTLPREVREYISE